MWYVDESSSADESADRELQSTWFTSALPRERTMQDVSETFAYKVRDTSKGVMLFGTVPPPLTCDQKQVRSIASSITENVKKINPDALVVYDIQDEPSRSGEPRPFPFFKTHQPRMFAGIMREMTNVEPIVFRAMVCGETKQDWTNWVNETTTEPYDMKNFAIVGGCREEGKKLLRVDEASQILQQQVRGAVVGGIVIPERHRDKQDEPQRVYEKMMQGVSFFTSQVVYHADNAIWFLLDYAAFCEEKKIEPVRIVFTFAPFSSGRTVKFMEWLGVEIPLGTQKRVLSRPTSTSRAAESVNICVDLAKRILDAATMHQIKVPLGFSVESVSKSKLEGRAAVQLFKFLEELLLHYYNEEDVMERMLQQDGTYIVQTQGGGVTVSKLGAHGPEAFAVVPRLRTNPHTLKSTVAALGGEKPKKARKPKKPKIQDAKTADKTAEASVNATQAATLVLSTPTSAISEATPQTEPMKVTETAKAEF